MTILVELSGGASLDAPPLRDYQEAAIECTIKRLRIAPRTWIELPTGTGKSRILRGLGSRAQRGRVLALAHTDILVHQLAASLGTDAVIMAEHNDTGYPLMVGSVQTLRIDSRMDDLLSTCETMGPISLLLIDECHHATTTNSYAKIIERLEHQLPNLKVVGVTATPIRQDGRDVEDVLGPPAFIRSILDMQYAGWLAPMRWQQINVGLDLTKIPVKAGDYDPTTIEPKLLEAVDAIVAHCAPIMSDRPTVVYGITVRHAQALADGFFRAGIDAAAVWGDQNRKLRSHYLDIWKRGELQVVCNVGVLTEGFDYPELACVIVARPTQSQGLYLQMVGRGLRKLQDKTTDIIDLGGNDNMIDPRQIILPDVAGIKIESDLDAIIPSDLDAPSGQNKPRQMANVKEHLSTKLIWRPIGDYLVCRLSAHKIAVMHTDPITGLVGCDVVLEKGSGFSVDHDAEHKAPIVIWRSPEGIAPRQASKLARGALKIHEQKALASASAKWRAEPASTKQLELITKLRPGIATTGFTKGEVALMIDDIFTQPLIRKLYG